MTQTDRPLSDVRVLDLTRLLPGPYATQLLGDLGAEVIKVEEPTVGDYYRTEEPSLDDGTSRIFATLNRNKKSVALDLKDDRGLAAFFELVETADVVIEGFRPGVAKRLGVDYESVTKRNERVVYCSLSGYGQNGPYEQWAGHDVNYVGIGGLLYVTGDQDDDPTIPGLPVADFAGGTMTALAAMVGLWSADRTGVGEYFDLSMTDVVVSWFGLYAPLVFDDDAQAPTRGGTMPAGKYPCYGVYPTADGGHLTLGAMEFKFWTATCEALSLSEYANREDHFPEGERSAEIRTALTDRFAEHTREEWLDRLDPTEVPVAPVNDPTEVFTDPQVRHRGMVTSLGEDENENDDAVSMVDSPVRPAGDYESVRRPHPGLGEHSRQLLLDAGLDEATVEKLFTDGVTTAPDRGDD
jgi:crotonobetainyl-CoA:carnitine CoA-transferase CaiB-like acyl-CoA transferase